MWFSNVRQTGGPPLCSTRLVASVCLKRRRPDTGSLTLGPLPAPRLLRGGHAVRSAAQGRGDPPGEERALGLPSGPLGGTAPLLREDPRLPQGPLKAWRVGGAFRRPALHETRPSRRPQGRGPRGGAERSPSAQTALRGAGFSAPMAPPGVRGGQVARPAAPVPAEGLGVQVHSVCEGSGQGLAPGAHPSPSPSPSQWCNRFLMPTLYHKQ